MGKVKGMYEEDMMKNPELYDGSNEYEFWIYYKKIKQTKKRRSNVRRKKTD
tara:strand:- start:338 stop:490 length:153 start_codon:yes stop_codon:yes gene_type:complete